MVIYLKFRRDQVTVASKQSIDSPEHHREGTLQGDPSYKPLVRDDHNTNVSFLHTPKLQINDTRAHLRVGSAIAPYRESSRSIYDFYQKQLTA